MNWEYRIIVMLEAEGRDLWTDECNHLGSQGWELVSVVNRQLSDRDRVRFYGYFKRPITSNRV